MAALKVTASIGAATQFSYDGDLLTGDQVATMFRDWLNKVNVATGADPAAAEELASLHAQLDAAIGKGAADSAELATMKASADSLKDKFTAADARAVAAGQSAPFGGNTGGV